MHTLTAMPNDVVPIYFARAAHIHSIEQWLGSISIKYTFKQVTQFYAYLIPIARV